MGASEACCSPPIAAVNRELQNPNGQTPYVQAPQVGNGYNEIQQQLLMERENIKKLMHNEKLYKDKIQAFADQNKKLKQKVNTLSKNAKSNKKKLDEKTEEIEKLLSDKKTLMKSSEEYKVHNAELTRTLTIKINELHENENPKQFRDMPPDVNYQDYDVVFETSSTGLGLLLGSLKDGKSALVKKCMTTFTKQNVSVGSIICEINGKNVLGLDYEIIRDMMVQHANKSVTITFRSKINGTPYKQINNVNERGILQIKVVGCIQLKHPANYVELVIGNTAVKTKEIKGNEHPEWMEVMHFKNYRCDRGKKALVTVYGKSTILRDKKIGSVEYELPVVVNKLSSDTLELQDNKGKLCGVINLDSKVIKLPV